MTFLKLFHALSMLPLALAHMQMINPSPLRDPHSNRADEPKDYNILTPLNADGSNFACKGYQFNTPWTSVATYQAGGTYRMALKGGATHGGGSCQLSFSCDGGYQFKVVKSIIGGCPLQLNYTFTVPPELGRVNGATCLFAWTWFNKVGNREMYMNCAVVSIIPPKSKSAAKSKSLNARDTSKANAAAQAALASYPDLFVANLASINDCVAKETYDVVFDDPGRDVAFGDDLSASAKPSFKEGECTGKGKKTAGSASSSSSSTGTSPAMIMGGDSMSSGDDGQWHATDSDQSPQSKSQTSGSDGQWHPELYGGSANNGASANAPQETSASDDSQQADLQPVDVDSGGSQPDPAVEQELDSYLKSLYQDGAPNEQREATNGQDEEQAQQPDQSAVYNDDEGSDFDPRQNPEDAYQYDLYYHRQRASRQQRWDSYKDSATNATQDETPAPAAAADDNIFADPELAALIARLNDLGSTVFTLVKFASQYLDQPPPSSVDDGVSAGASSYPLMGDDGFSDDSKAPVPRGDQPALVEKRQDSSQDNGLDATLSEPFSDATVDSIIDHLETIYNELGKIGNSISVEAGVKQALKDDPERDAIYNTLYNKVNQMEQMSFSLYQYITEPVAPPPYGNGRKRANLNIDSDNATPSMLESITKPLQELNDQMDELIHYVHEIAEAIPKTAAKSQGTQKAETRPTVHDTHSRPSVASAGTWSKIKRTLSGKVWKRQDPPFEPMFPEFAADGTPLPPGGIPEFAADGTPLPPGGIPQFAPDGTPLPPGGSPESLADDPRGSKPATISDPGEGLPGNGVAEAMFPDFDDGLPDPTKEPAFDWSTVYSHLGGEDTSEDEQPSDEPSPEVGEESVADVNATEPDLSNVLPDLEPAPSAQPQSAEDVVVALSGGNLTVWDIPLVNVTQYNQVVDGSAIANATSFNQTTSAEASDDGQLDTSSQPEFDWGSLYPHLANTDKPRHGHSVPMMNATEPDQDQHQDEWDEAEAAPSDQPESAEDVDVTESEQLDDGTPAEEPTDTTSDPADLDSSESAQAVEGGNPDEWEDEMATEENNPDDYEDEPAAEEPTSTDAEPTVPDPSESAQDYEGADYNQDDGAAPVDEFAPSSTTDSESAPATTDDAEQTLGEALRDAFPELAAQYSGNSREESEGEWSGENEDNWVDGVLPGYVRTAKPSSIPNSVPKADANEDAAAMLPYFMGPGPVIPEGMNIDWPGPSGPVDNLEDTPALTNDLGPDADEQVLKFFAALKKYMDGTGPAPPVKRQASPQLLDPNDQFVGNDDDLEWLMSLFPELRNDPDPLGSTSGRQAVDDLETFPTVVDDLTPSAEDEVRKWFADLAKSNKQPSPAAVKRLLSRQIASLPTLEELFGSSVVLAAAAATLSALEPSIIIAAVSTPTSSEIPAIVPVIATPTPPESSDLASTTPTPTTSSSPTPLSANSAEQSCLQKKTSVEGSISGWQKELAEPCGQAAPFAQYADPVFLAPFLSLMRACNKRQDGLRDKIKQYQADLITECGGVLGVAQVNGVQVLGGGGGGA